MTTYNIVKKHNQDIVCQSNLSEAELEEFLDSSKLYQVEDFVIIPNDDAKQNETTKQTIEDAINRAIDEENKIQKVYTDAFKKGVTDTERHDILNNIDTTLRTQQAGRVTVTATAGGNSKAKHIRLTFKIDGKRASKKVVEETFYQS